MQRRRIQLAVVVDEYGASQGIVTVGDIIEEIVGAIPDDRERTPSQLVRLPDGSYLVAGRMWIEELNEALDWSLPTKKDYETVAGLILASLGRIPRPGEQVTIGGYELAVVDADERRILKVKIRGRERAADAAPARPPTRRPHAARRALSMTGSMVTFPANGATTSGYLATPKSGAGPGVLVIQEWWGLVPHIKHVCDRFAAEGFVALAPDMYHGQTASEPDDGRASSSWRSTSPAPRRTFAAPRRTSWPGPPRRRSGRWASAWAASSRSSRRRSIPRSGRA